ncbi:NADPH-dependent F420 reductase [Gluconobacter kanchanaburiensis]|uniref:NADP oxidoreductase n=1 Tax=Gluconobacter kanchanaburiensis NBRC 103587 TaxID=1307948 RepID=A0A511BF03_9PROT|nr:NADPH-dependent F420 reductase [Gluconobacter kanchanaburiensis]MBF0862348.1 NADPH-dependent F420 reductase [Gluconobacter kanchanaburiensis]GBR68824.1 oxidoreductase [Gluconobacter kanchanaburiensis NBRC 103587]GEK96337.1 NADP oxidoreductase [Gluconobacter kanchanaburiensis NBRC 103587]
MTGFPLRRRPFLAALAGLATVSSASAVEAPTQKTRIGIIGTGHVGTTLAELWVRAGYHVMVSARSLMEAQSLATSLGPLATAGTPAQAAVFGDVVVLAVPYGAIPQLGPQLSRTLMDKIVLDPSNPYPWRDGAIADTAQRDGAGVTTQRYFPSAHVVRAFNSIDMSTLRSEAHRVAPLLAVPVAGDDAQAVSQVSVLVKAAGFDPVVTGNLATAKLFQPGSTGFELERDVAGLKQALNLPQ